MENLEVPSRNKVEKLSIASLEKQSALIEIFTKQIDDYKEAIKLYQEQIDSSDTPEEDRKNYLIYIENLKNQITELEEGISGFKKSIETLSLSVLENTNLGPNSKAN